MTKTALRIAEIDPITDPPAYHFLAKRAAEISEVLKAAELVKDKRGGFGFVTSLKRRTPAEWDRAVWEACVKFGPDAVRVAGRCLKKRGQLWFLPKSRQPTQPEHVRRRPHLAYSNPGVFE